MVVVAMAVAALIKMITIMVRVSFCEHFLRPSRFVYSLMLILMRKASQDSYDYSTVL